MRALVCGGRDFQDYLFFAQAMVRLQGEYGRFATIIHGGAKGADWCAHLFAGSPAGSREELEFKADWKNYGRKAGPQRNQRMIDEGKPDLVIAFPGGSGTADMVRRAKRAGIPIVFPAPSQSGGPNG